VGELLRPTENGLITMTVPKHSGGGKKGDSLSALERLQNPLKRRKPTVDPANTPDDARYAQILEISASLASTLDLTHVLSNIVDGIIDVTGCERGFLMLKETDGTFSMHIGRTSDRGEWGRDDIFISRTIVDGVVKSGRPFIESNLEDVEQLKDAGSIHDHSIRSAICVPLFYKGGLVGVIYADSHFIVPQVFESERRVLDAFAGQAAIAIENARQHGELRTREESLEEQNLSLRHQLGKQFNFSGMVSKNRRMLDVFESVKKIAAHDINVVIRGESGTGKELLARAIHERSSRSDGPFETVNCAGIPVGLVESILFGHKRGSFTGAVQDKAGVFEMADRGTLFLDEIGDMPLEIQPKILRALQEKEVTRVGEEGRVRPIDVRILAATHMDLSRAVEEGRFREDLFFRLNSARISLIPLRERREDIVPLAEHFLKMYAEEKHQPLALLGRDARELLMNHDWKGNVRELKSAVEWGIVFQDDHHVIHASELGRFFERSGAAFEAPPEQLSTLKSMMTAYEEKLICRMLRENNNVITVSARALGISRQQLHAKIRKYKITIPRD